METWTLKQHDLTAILTALGFRVYTDPEDRSMSYVCIMPDEQRFRLKFFGGSTIYDYQMRIVSLPENGPESMHCLYHTNSMSTNCLIYQTDFNRCHFYQNR